MTSYEKNSGFYSPKDDLAIAYFRSKRRIFHYVFPTSSHFISLVSKWDHCQVDIYDFFIAMRVRERWRYAL